MTHPAFHLLVPWFCLMLLTGPCLTGAPTPSSKPEPTSRLRVCTFNLRYAGKTPPNSWSERREAMRACWKHLDADLVGTQEGLFGQLKDIASDQPGYDWVGLGRDGGSEGEFMAVFYRKRRFEVMEFDHFWLSDTPSVMGSSTWGNSNRRMVTWVRFRDRKDSREFYLMNTHLDHALQPAREKGARLIRERVLSLNTNLPVLLIGDFNAEPGKEPTHAVFTQDQFFRDAWLDARERMGDGLSTFHNFKGPVPGTFRIDWILTRGPWRSDKARVVVFTRKGQYPSDHHPVVADLTW